MDRQKFLSGRWVLFVMLASVVLWAIMVFGTLAHVRQLAGGIDPFDVRPFGYSTGQARALLDALGEAGRDFYANVQLRIDLVYPATYALSRGLLLWWVTVPGRLWAAPLPVSLRIFLLFPSLASAGFDYAENVQIARMLAVGPTIDSAVIETASRMTMIKSIATSLNEALVIGLAVVAAMRWRSRPK